MKRLAAVAVALLVIAWQSSPRKMVAGQTSGWQLPPPDKEDDDTPRYGIPLTPPPPGASGYPPVTPLPDSPPQLPEPAIPEPIEPPHQQQTPPPPRQDRPPEPETPKPTAPPQPWQAPFPPRQGNPPEPETPEPIAPPHPRQVPPQPWQAPLPPRQDNPPAPETPEPIGRPRPQQPPPQPWQAPLPPRQDSPPEPEPPEPIARPHPQQPPPHPRQPPSSPRWEPLPPRAVVPPQEPGWAAVPLPLPPQPAPAVINYTATGFTTMLVFGDSTVDSGNNNRLQTAAKANFLPYGMSFPGGRPTGRFTNGRLITDMLAEKLGIARSIPGFLEPRLRLRQLRRGVSFASAGSGFDDATARISNAISFSNQVEELWRYRRNLQRLVGPRRADQLFRRATFVISAGTTDLFLQHYASNQSREDSRPQYESLLMTHVANFTQVMRALGGRRFVFIGVPPIGCLPIVRTLEGLGAERCHENMNSMAMSFNERLAELVRLLKNEPSTRATFIDIYTIIGQATINPTSFGLTEISRGCCGTGIMEIGQTCRGRRACSDPSKYLYWDAVHQTEKMNQIITDQVIMSSIGEIYV